MVAKKNHKNNSMNLMDAKKSNEAVLRHADIAGLLLIK